MIVANLLLCATCVCPALEKARDWKGVYSSAEGLEGRALAVLTEAMTARALRDPGTTTSHVFPLEKAGAAKGLSQKNRILIGCPSSHAGLRALLKSDDVPRGGYFIGTFSESGTNTIAVAGDSPREVLWAAFDFADTGIREIEAAYLDANDLAAGTVKPWQVFAADALPAFAKRCAPETEVRSAFSWGHVIDDCGRYFRELARLRFTRVILWNEFPPVNAAEVVREAHEWGLELYWGFAWGWTADMCASAETGDIPKLVDSIVAEWRTTWRPLGGDGIYFQTFTEQNRETIDGRSIASLAVETVNGAVRRIRAEAPGLDIVFGLHANSVKQRLGEIEKTDKGVEILWENCGGFPFNESRFDPDTAFVDALLETERPVGLVWKAQPRQDWSCWKHPAGPSVLGAAGDPTLRRDRALVREASVSHDEAWYRHGRKAYELLRHVRGGAHPPKELNAVAEYNPPFRFSTVVQAELFWSTADDWETVLRRARAKALGGSRGADPSGFGAAVL